MRKLLIFTIFALWVTVLIFAQSSLWYSGPSHPANPQIGQPRILADTVLVMHGMRMDLSPESSEEMNFQPELSTIIKRSEDGLRDTFYMYGTSNNIDRISVFEYDANDRLIFVREKNDHLASFIEIEEFEYDSSGRLTKYFEWSTPGVFLYYDYSTIVYTDSSYFLNQSEYVFDSKNRLIRAGKTHYSYFETGYYEIESSDLKTKYELLENGYRSKKRIYKKILEQWVNSETWETEYRYVAGNPYNPTGSTDFEDTFRKVYGIDGALIIQSDMLETARIFSYSGLWVRNVQAGAGVQSIAIPRGFYFVLIGNNVYKVMVR